MDRQTLMDQAQTTMARYVCKDIHGEEKQAMTVMVKCFFAERASQLDTTEIFDHMATPMKSLEWFNTYLCEKFWQNCCINPFPEFSDTCSLI